MRLKTLVESGDPERLATGYQFTEGPVWMPQGYLLFSDIPASRIYRWSPTDGASVWRFPSGQSNGLTRDIENRLVACEHGNRRVTRTERDGTVVSIADRFEGGRLNSPNDVVVKSDGAIYFTDPPYGIRSEQREQAYNGVYRISPDGVVSLVADDFERPNGLAFSPDESTLYIDDSYYRHVRALEVRADGSLSNSRILADMDHPQPGSPDGMKVDVEGHIYVTGATGIWVFDPAGGQLGTIVPPERPANCAWGGDDRKSLYITAQSSLYRVRVKVAGCPVVGTP